MNNFKKVSIAEESRIELHDTLNLTGAEVSVNTLPAGVGVPFVHSHKQNEEIYAILDGQGIAVIDGESVSLKAGDWVRISPSAKRQFFASADTALKYVCIQVKEGSLEGFTMTDAVVL
ncbi:MAG: cupin domain-containing protein [Clostridia bacterium]|nr:cupin domain-containing protein [Clostridia bacterium]